MTELVQTFGFAILALIATPEVSDPESLPYRVFEGTQVALQATEACIDDGRDMRGEGFMIKQYTKDNSGEFMVRCQMLDTLTGPYYGSKGFYLPTPLLPALIELFKGIGVEVTDTPVTHSPMNPEDYEDFDFLVYRD